MSPSESQTRKSRVGLIVYRILLGGVAALTCGVAAVVAATGGGGDAGPASTSEWTAGTLSPDPGRTEVGAARIDDQIYVVGGFRPAGMSGAVTAWVRRYDIGDDQWTDRCVTPNDPPGCIATMPTAVNHPAVTSYGGRLYVHGGWTSNGLTQPTNKLQRYDPETNTWELLTPTVNARAAHTIEALDGKLYAVGGVQGPYNIAPRASMSIYNIAKNKWKSGPAMSVAREHLTGVALDGRIWVIAGRRNPGGVNLDAFERYNPATGSWKALPDVQVPRSGIASGTAHGKIVVFGGEELSEGNSTIEEVEIYDRSTGAWDFLPDMLIPRHGHGGASYQGRVYALEGGPVPAFSYTRSVEYLDIPE